MKILIDRLSQTPAELVFGPDDPGWDEVLESVPEMGGPLGARPTATIRAHRMGRDVYLEGSLEGGALDLECGRCLVRYGSPLRESFRLVLEPAGGRVPAEPEAARDLARLGMCLGDELEMGWFQGPEIDLRAWLREVVALTIPVQPLCREECRGLCPRCGADRNRETCACEAERPASPFAALEALRRRPGR
ncbi:MAG TPA: DUF177 domain-containing protein [Myxococcota bacterium]|jgi:uncharacterized protein